jgi:RNA polymerase sigma-70 factor, ECF subfamily
MATAQPLRIGVEAHLERHRVELTSFCRRMLGSGEEEDAVQETFLRAWRSFERFEGRSSLRAWLRRIATNVCLDMLEARSRRPRPVDLQFGTEPIANDLGIAATRAGGRTTGDSAEEAVIERDAVSRAFVATFQLLPPRQRAVLILCEVLRWQAREVAELLETSVPSVNSALERARTTLRTMNPDETATALDPVSAQLVTRYVDAFQCYDIEAVTSLLHRDAQQAWSRGKKRPRRPTSQKLRTGSASASP